jgi:DNA-directed RNA polymerase specialized sigma24 family protein
MMPGMAWQPSALKGQIVKLRFFGGLSLDEAAEVLSVSPETVMRDWVWAKARLFRELERRRC